MRFQEFPNTWHPAMAACEAGRNTFSASAGPAKTEPGASSACRPRQLPVPARCSGRNSGRTRTSNHSAKSWGLFLGNSAWFAGGFEALVNRLVARVRLNRISETPFVLCQDRGPQDAPRRRVSAASTIAPPTSKYTEPGSGIAPSTKPWNMDVRVSPKSSPKLEFILQPAGPWMFAGLTTSGGH